MNKPEIMTKKHDKKCLLAPRLRFPEFRDEWYSQALGAIASIIKEKARDKKCTLMSIVAGVGLISQIEKFGKEIAGNQYKNYIILRKGDFAYNKSATKDYPQGFIALYTGHEIAAVPNSIFTCFKVQPESIVPAYLNYLFLGNFHGKWLRRYITVGARAHGSLSIDDDDLLSLPIPYPKGVSSLGEQQKIADCFSSLDERIAAETSKLHRLKDHKKGLLKQLFPAEGETLPQLRFPEFRDGGEWEINLLSQISENLDNRRVPITENMRIRGAIPYYGASGIVDYVNDFIFDEELLCISEDGANLICRTTPIAFPISGKSWVNNHAHVLKFSSRARQKLVEEYINFIKIDDFLTGMAQPKLNKSKLEVIPLPTPPTEKEQQKIADCLSSLDELITAQAQKIDLLKDHKKGLMQQLFPRIDEVLA